MVTLFSCENVSSDYVEIGVDNDTLIGKEAIALFHEENYEESLRLLNYSIEKYPEVAELYFWKGKNLDALDSGQLALDFYSEAILLNPHNAKYLNNRGLLFFDLKRWELAEIDLKKALNLDSALGAAYNNLGLVYNQKEDYGAAIDAYNQSVNHGFRNKKVFYNKGISFINIAEFDSANVCLSRVIEIDPLLAEAYLYRGICYYKMGHKIKGCSDFWEAKNLGSFDADAYLKYCES